MPRRFAFPFGADVWTPVSPQIGATYIDNPSWGALYVVGRLRPDVSPLQAKMELDPLIRQQAREYIAPGAEALAGVVTPLTEHRLGNTEPILLALGGTGGIVLAIACANIVGLLLVRAIARRRESAVRSALGASSWRIASLWLTETLLLAGVGLVGGLLLVWWGTRALVALAPESTPQLDRIALTWPVVVFAVVVCLTSATVCGLVPSWLMARLNLWASLQEGARAARTRFRLHTGARMTLDVSADAEVDESGVNEPMPGGLDAPQRKWLEYVRREEARAKPYRLAFDGILEGVRALPQVRAAGGASQLPLIDGPIGTDASILLEGQAPYPADDWKKNPFVNQMSATDGYFEAMGNAARRGTPVHRARHRYVGARGDHRPNGGAPVLSGPRGGRPPVERRRRAKGRDRQRAGRRSSASRAPGALTPKQQRFVAEYLVDLNATQAAIRTAYGVKIADSVGSETWETLIAAKSTSVLSLARRIRRFTPA
jgi:hypothetical protein